jgi:hypothetical protein
MEQGQLFDLAQSDSAIEVPGLTLQRDYVTPDDERQLLHALENGPWETDWRRRIQQFGVGYSDTGGKPTWIRDFPDWLNRLAVRVGQDARCNI